MIDIDADLLNVNVEELRWDLWKKAMEVFSAGINEELKKRDFPVEFYISCADAWLRKTNRFGFHASIKKRNLGL